MHRYSRWDKDVISACMQIYNRSPQAYADISSSGLVVFPSSRLLRLYKNVIRQRPGLNSDMFSWMNQAADENNVSAAGRRGGIIFDEMCIQGDLQMTKEGNNTKFVGFQEMGDECNDMSTIL